MIGKTAVGILVIVFIGAGIVYFTKEKAEAPEIEGDASGTEEMTWVPSAPFSCTNGESFVAEFPNDEQVRILVDGEEAVTLPRGHGPEQRFENETHAYVFAGEELTVTTKATGAIATCAQPFDPNNAPMNFGDRGEGGGAQPDMVLVVSESIVGKWQSFDDAKFSREFKEGGVVVDAYEGGETLTGTWTAFSNEDPFSVPFPLERDRVYIRIDMEGTYTGTLHFKVSKLTPEELELVYMDRGGTLRFKSI